MAFKVFEKGSAPMPSIPSVTIQKRGLVSLNDAASELIGNPEAVQFLWDASDRLIALKPVALTAPNAYPVREQAAAKKRGGAKRGAVLIAGSMFTRFIGLDTTQARRWVPEVRDGMLILDVKQEGQLVIANRNRGKTDADETGAAPDADEA